MSQLPISNLTSLNSDTKIVEPIFDHHKTFHPLFCWLKKGFDLVTRDSNILQKDNAPV